MIIRDLSGTRLKRMPRKVGTIFFLNWRPYRRGRGILYAVHFARQDPMLRAAFWKRFARRLRK